MTETGPAAASEQGGRPGSPPKTLLVVDDEPFILSALAAYFHHMVPGLHVVVAKSAAEGLACMQESRIDVVVSDYRMPDMDGLTFLRHCANEYPSTRRLLFTANIDLHLLEQARDDLACHAWLQKGCDPQRLLDAVQDALAQQAAPPRLAMARGASA